jgi:hypothetical protein
MTDRGAPHENAFGHLTLSHQLAAASRRCADCNPSLAQELADESRALLAFVLESEPVADVAEPIVEEFDEADGSGPKLQTIS